MYTKFRPWNPADNVLNIIIWYKVSPLRFSGNLKIALVTNNANIGPTQKSKQSTTNISTGLAILVTTKKPKINPNTASHSNTTTNTIFRNTGRKIKLTPGTLSNGNITDL